MSISSSSSIVVGKSSGLYVNNAFYPNNNRALAWNQTSNLGLISKCKHKTSLKGSKRNSFVVYANIIPGADPLPAGPPPSGSMKSWILGIVVSLVLPFFTHKWGPLWVLKNRIESAVQTVEDIVEAAEKVAGEVDKIAEDIARDLPEGKLKQMVELVEDIAEKTAKTADSLDNIIDKVQEAEDQVESIVESVVTKSSQKETKDQ